MVQCLKIFIHIVTMQLHGAFLISKILLSLIRFVKVKGELTDAISPFIEPKEVSDLEDIFVRGNTEYLYINYPIDHFAASVLCTMSYRGRLALVETVDLAKFLAEALSETNLEMEVLWIGGKLIDETWNWYEGEKLVGPVEQEIIDLFVNYSKSLPSDERQCLGFARKDHDIPHFPTLKCTVLRPFMCERDARDRGNGSTHPGWIKIGKRLYKIFQERVSWISARAKCVVYDSASRLAVLTNFVDSQELGRYLLIGRPSLENAWIGAKYYTTYYAFRQEDIILHNITDTERYPPWRNGRLRKPGGCLLLDRHLDNITLFVEARCERLRPYICYKMDKSSWKGDNFTDILIEEFGYRIYYHELSWDRAVEKCNHYKEKYNAKLVEIRERRIVAHLIYVMGENRTSFQHVWLGGILDPVINQWCWNSDQTLIDVTILDWLSNNTYFERAERFNTCLNMDRENHLQAMHYGAICDFPQNFICMFPREKLIQLQIDEAKNNSRRVLLEIIKRKEKRIT